MTDGRRPTSALERALAALEVGQQGSWEGGESLGNRDRCARCLRFEPDGKGELCPGCRAFLLEDTTVDPADPEVVTLRDDTRVFHVQVVPPAEIERFTRELCEAFSAFTELAADAASAALAVVQLTPPWLLELYVELEQVLVAGQALGLTEERCATVADEELDRCRETMDGIETVVERVRARLYHEGGACSCLNGEACGA